MDRSKPFIHSLSAVRPKIILFFLQVFTNLLYREKTHRSSSFLRLGGFARDILFCLSPMNACPGSIVVGQLLGDFPQRRNGATENL
jgi:hypothetical protein